MSRDRKPSAYFASSFAVDDGEFKKLIKDYQKNRPPTLKKPAQSQPVIEKTAVPVEKSKSLAIEKVDVSKVPKNKEGKVNRGKWKALHSQPPIITAQARAQEEIEENHIARSRERNLKTTRPRKVLPEGAVELPDLETAVKRGVKECSTLLLEWASPKAKMIGCLCKVYWDGEDTWFYARILNYDSFYDRHYVSLLLLTSLYF